MQWQQVYDPLGSALLSTLVAAIPIVVLLGCIASGRVKAHIAALIALAAAFLVAVVVVGMPAGLAGRAVLMGAAYGLLPICWIVLNILPVLCIGGLTDGPGLLASKAVVG